MAETTPYALLQAFVRLSDNVGENLR
jgi:hypothetical protein